MKASLLVRTSLLCCAAVAAAGLSAGCRDSGPPRYDLSGAVTYEGHPVPFGWLVFVPENGPGASADIEGGRYQTPKGWGTVGGPHTIEVTAGGIVVPSMPNRGAATSEKLAFSCTLHRDIPKETTTWDIEITREDLQGGSDATGQR